jgi:acetyl esterase/lipase
MRSADIGDRRMPPLIRTFVAAAGLISTFVVADDCAGQGLTFRQVLDRADRPLPDHKIAYDSGPNQYGELWLPDTPSLAPLPVVVLIHGGCWLSEYPGPELIAFLSDDLRKQGVAVWSISYRRVGIKENVMGGGYPATFLDIAHGVDHLRNIAAQYRLDLNRVIASGHSAGGHLALWAAARPKLPAGSALHIANPLPIKAVVGIAAIPDLAYAATAVAHACERDTIDKLVDTARRGGKDAFLDTSPIEMLPLGVKQILVSGIYDGVVAPVIGWRYRNSARARGETVEIVNIDNAGHFELISPWTAPGKIVVDKILAAVGETK